MVYAEYLAFWIILLPFIVKNNLIGAVEAQEGTTEIYEILVLFNATDSNPDFNATDGYTKMLTIMPSSSIAPSILTPTLNNDSTVINTTTIMTMDEDVGSQLPIDAGLTTPFSSSKYLCSSKPFDCISKSFLFDIATFLHSSSSKTNNINGTLTCFQKINSCNNFCSRFFDGECFRISSSLATIENYFFNSNNFCEDFNVVCFFPYNRILATTMIFTTIALITAIIAAYKFLKARRASSVTLLSYQYTGNLPDLRNLYNNGEPIILQEYDTVHFDNENANVTILSSKN